MLSLSNHTGFWRIADQLHTRYHKLYKRKAHLHHYLEWMEEDEFKNAQKYMQAIIRDYRTIEMGGNPFT